MSLVFANKGKLLSRYLRGLSHTLQLRTLQSEKLPDSSPLSGVRILDMTRIVAGPFCTMILGDLGAEVLKVERPGSGDEARQWGPPFVTGTDQACYFLAMNRNKLSVCVDFSVVPGRDIILDLVRKCDVLVENFVPGKLATMGLGYDDLKDACPGLVYCSLSGYGPDGPYARRPGYDVIAASLGGLLHITGPQDGEPCKVGVAMTDMATGLYAHGAILAALLQRGRTGRGQKIDCDLLSTQVASLINISSNYLNAGQEAKRWGTAHESLVPYQSFPTSDQRYLTVCAGSDKQFQSLCGRLELWHLSADQRFRSNEQRVINRVVLVNILRARFVEKTLEEWLEILEGSLFPYGPVNNLSQVFSDPHVVQRGMVKEMDHPSAGRVRVVGPPVRYSEADNRARLPPPLLGQHTAQVLAQLLGYSTEKLNQLIACKAIQ